MPAFRCANPDVEGARGANAARELSLQRLMRPCVGATRRLAVAVAALALLPLCARAAGNGVHVGDGLYSGGSSLFDINASACPPPPSQRVRAAMHGHSLACTVTRLLHV